MGKIRILFVSLSVFLIYILLCSCGKKVSEEEAVVAFAKSYGLIRWFCPSDEAQMIDWNKFALYGVDEVMKCRTEQELIETLNKLFLPVAPSAQFTDDDKVHPFSWGTYNIDTTGLLPVCWQHSGVELDESNFYVSKRFNTPYPGDGLAKLCLFKYIPGGEYAGYTAKLKMSIKTESPHGNFYAEPLLTSYAQNDIQGYVNSVKNNKPQKLQSQRWTVVEKEVQIKDDPNNDILWGIYVDGDGTLYVDNIELLIEKNGKFQQIYYCDFENSNNMMWQGYSLYDFASYEDNPFAEKKSLRITTKNKIFGSLPDNDEVITQNISKNIKLYFPLVLYKNKEGGTLPVTDSTLFDKFRTRVNGQNVATDTVNRLADIVVSWNIVNHFSPYLKDSKPDWEKELSLAIDRILYNKEDEAKYALELMMAALNDAHYIRFPEKFYEKFRLPFVTGKIEGKIVITDSFNEIYRKGDIIENIKGENALALYEKAERLTSGSDQRKQVFAGLYYWDLSDSDEDVEVTYKRDDEVLSTSVKPIPSGDFLQKYYEQRKKSKKDDVKEFENAIYIKLEGLNLEEVGECIKAHKDKVPIIDVRYGGFAFLVRYILPFLGESEYAGDISSTPNVIRPNEVILGEVNMGEFPRREKPQAIILMGPDNISNQEEFLDYVKCKNLGILIGTNSAGCSGRINMAKLPSGEQWCYTGMRAYSRCGEDFFANGVTPHYIVVPTIDDIKTGHDPVIEKALEVAQTMNK